MSCVKQVIRGSYTGSTTKITVNFNATINPSKSLIFTSSGSVYREGNEVIFPIIVSLSEASFVSYGGWQSSSQSGTCYYQIIEFA